MSYIPAITCDKLIPRHRLLVRHLGVAVQEPRAKT